MGDQVETSRRGRPRAEDDPELRGRYAVIRRLWRTTPCTARELAAFARYTERHIYRICRGIERSDEP